MTLRIRQVDSFDCEVFIKSTISRSVAATNLRYKRRKIDRSYPSRIEDANEQSIELIHIETLLRLFVYDKQSAYI